MNVNVFFFFSILVGKTDKTKYRNTVNFSYKYTELDLLKLSKLLPRPYIFLL